MAHRKAVQEVRDRLWNMFRPSGDSAERAVLFCERALASETLAGLFAKDPDLGFQATYTVGTVFLVQPWWDRGRGRGRPFEPWTLLGVWIESDLSTLGSEACHRIAHGLAQEVLGENNTSVEEIARRCRQARKRMRDARPLITRR